MLPKKTPMTQISNPIYRKKLEYLYARRSSIDTLIQSLEEYDRFHAKDADRDKRKSA